MSPLQSINTVNEHLAYVIAEEWIRILLYDLQLRHVIFIRAASLQLSVNTAGIDVRALLS